MTALVVACVLSSLVVLVLGGIMLRRWARKKADLMIWTQHQQKLRNKTAPEEESTETWRDNQRMDMR